MTQDKHGRPRGGQGHRFGLQVVIGMGAGVALGLAARAWGPNAAGEANGLALTLSLIGSSFVQLLKALVPPLVLAAIIASIGRLRDLNNAARLAGQTLVWFAITALIAVGIGIALGLVLRPGARVPADGVIRTGSTSVDEASITGESMPVVKEPGAPVFEATVNLDGVVEVVVTKTVAESTVARMISLV